MDVRDFVKTSLVQIVQGVSDAANEIQSVPRAMVNPSASHSNYSPTTEIGFDIAVTIQENADIQGSAGIEVLGAKFGVGADKALSNTAHSRLSFSVPVSLPSKAAQQYQHQEVRRNNRSDGF